MLFARVVATDHSHHQSPTGLVAHLTHQSFGRLDVRKEQRIADRIERGAKHPEMIGGGRVKRGESVLLCQAMVCRELKAATAHLLVVLEIWPAAPPPPLLDLVGNDSAQ